ncbi:MAG: hypothetical protein ACK518_00875 [bacterium]
MRELIQETNSLDRALEPEKDVELEQTMSVDQQIKVVDEKVIEITWINKKQM